MTRGERFRQIKLTLGGISYTQEEVNFLDKMMDRRGIPHEHRVYTLQQPTEFFDRIRKLTGGLDQIQVDTINQILRLANHWPLGWVAYGLATAWWEAKLRPIDEYGKGRGRPYGRPGIYKQIPYGRGLVQLTWDQNYEWADDLATKQGFIKKGEILRNFDLVKRPDIAVLILVRGMETGAFCRDKNGPHNLKRHIDSDDGTYEEFITARRIINGVDKKETIAKIALIFQEALKRGQWA